MKNRKKLIGILAGVMAAVMVLTLLLSLLPTRVSAASSSEIRKQINSLKEQHKENQSQLEDLKADYEANSDEIAEMVNRKNLIDQEIGLLHAQMDNLNEQISAYSVLIADKQDELDHAQDRYETMNAEYKSRIRAMEEDGSLSYWEVLFNATSFSNLLDRLSMVEEIAASDRRRMQELSDAADQVDLAREELANEKLELDGAREELEATQTELDGKRAEADELLKQLLDKADEIQGLKEQLETEDQDLLDTIAQKEQEYNEARHAEWLAYMATYTTVPPETTSSGDQTGGNTGDSGNSGDSGNTGGNTGSSTWLRPCSYNQVSSPYGLREAPTAGASTFHQGIDLRTPVGTSVYASRTGVVTVASYSDSAGHYVLINHGDGFSSIYMHLSSYSVSPGQAVSAGQQIALSGASGRVTGAHLHFGILYNGAYVNPASYISF